MCACACAHASRDCLVEKFPITCLAPFMFMVRADNCQCLCTAVGVLFLIGIKLLFHAGKNKTNFVFEWNSKNYIDFFVFLY